MEEASLFKSFSVALISLLILKTIFSSKTRKPKHRLPPGPRGLPIAGHLHRIGPPLHRSFHNLSSKYGPIIHLRLGSNLAVLASTPDIAKELLKTHDLAFSNRPQSIAIRRFAYDSAGFAFAPYGPYWKFMKKLCMSELLGGRTVGQLLPVRRSEMLTLLETLSSKALLREPVDVSDELVRMTNNIITRMTTSMTSSSSSSSSSSGEGDDPEEARKLVKQVAELAGAFNLADFIWFCRNWDLQGLDKRNKEVLQRFDAMMERIIKDKEEARKKNKENERATAGGGDGGVKDLLDILLQVSEDKNAEVKLTRENIKGFALDVLSAGSDSSAATIEWALSELINHPTMLEEAKQELDRVVGKFRLVEENDIPNLPYLQAVVKETLRLHPTSPLIIREAVRDIKIGDYDIPAGTTLFVNIWSLGRDPDHWDEPLEFNPQRFMVHHNNSTASSSLVDVRGQHFHLLPFGSGRRGCPAASLALPVVLATLALLVQCFEWKMCGEIDMTEGVGLVIPRAHPIVCVPIARLNPFPGINMNGN